MLSPVCILTDLIVLPLPMKISSAILIFHFLRSSRLLLSLRRGGSRIAATSKMERFVIIVNDFQPLTIITKRSILDVVAVLDPPLLTRKSSLLLNSFSKRNNWLAAFHLFCMFTQSIKFYTFHYYALRVQMLEKWDSSNRQ